MKAISISHYAKVLGIDNSTVHKKIKQGKLQSTTIVENNRTIKAVLVDDNFADFKDIQEGVKDTIKDNFENVNEGVKDKNENLQEKAEEIKDAEFVRQDSNKYELDIIKTSLSKIDDLVSNLEASTNIALQAKDETINTKEDIIKSKDETINTQKYEIQRQNETINRQLVSIDNLNGIIKTLTDDNNALRTQIAVRDSEQKIIEKMLEDLKNVNKELEEKNKSYHKDLESKINHQEVQIQDIITENEDYKKQLEYKDHDIKELTDKIKLLEASNNMLINEKESLKKENEELEHKHGNEVKALLEQINKLEVKNKEIKEEVDQLEGDKASLLNQAQSQSWLSKL